MTDTTDLRGPDETGTDQTATRPEDSASAEPSVDSPAPDTPASDSGGTGRRWLRPALWSVTAALIVVLAGLSLFFWIEHRSSRQIDDARSAVLAATRSGATAVLTYRAASAQADVDATQKLLTGGFADEYRSLARTDVLPAARDRGLSSTVNISGVSVVNIGRDSAESMVFVTQQVSSQRQGEKPTTTATAVRIGLVRQNDQWLIEAFTPI